MPTLPIALGFGGRMALVAFNAGNLVQLAWVWRAARPWLREQQHAGATGGA